MVKDGGLEFNCLLNCLRVSLLGFYNFCLTLVGDFKISIATFHAISFYTRTTHSIWYVCYVT